MLFCYNANICNRIYYHLSGRIVNNAKLINFFQYESFISLGE